LEALGVATHTLAGFPSEYRAGAAARAKKIGDFGPSDPDNWDLGMADPKRVHVLWSIHANSRAALQARQDELTTTYGTAASIVHAYDAEAMHDDSGQISDRVHFGYADGISQPRIEGFDQGAEPDGQPVSPSGAFFAGHESQFEGVVFDLPDPAEFTGNGTYNAFRVLEQDVFAFERFLQQASADSGLDVEMIAAKVCGRFRDGRPLPPDARGRNEYGYADDPDGDVCPIGSHMRRANPRDGEVVQRASAHTRRIIRRGMPYGPAIAPGDTEPDGVPRGLLGNFLCGSLIAQFEAIMYDWVNLGLQHPDITGTNDPLLGANDASTSRFVIPRADDSDIVLTGFPRFIRTRAAAYTFMPSIPGLRWLAAH
jgi:deferrochelatase/peroxidase EfeB